MARRRFIPGSVIMGYADDTVDVSQSPEQLRKFKLVIVVVRAAFGLPVSNIWPTRLEHQD